MLACGENPPTLSLQHLVRESILEFAHTTGESCYLILETQNAGDSLKTHAFAAEALHFAQLLNVSHGVAARTTGRSLRLHEPDAVVLPERLRVHSRKLGGDRDGEDR